MKTLSLKYKLVALVLVLAFTFQSMESINSHTYTTGIYNIHSHFTVGCLFSSLGNNFHMSFNCPY